MKKMLLMLSVLLVSASASCASDFYFSAKGGAFFPSAPKSSRSPKTGYNHEIAIGAKMHPNLALEVGGGNYASDRIESWRQTSGTTPGGDRSVSVIPVTITLKGILPLGMVDLFAGGGGGYYYATLKSKLYSTIIETNADATGYHFVGGFDVNLTDSTAIGAEIKQVYVRAFKGEDIDCGGTVANASLKLKFR